MLPSSQVWNVKIEKHGKKQRYALRVLQSKVPLNTEEIAKFWHFSKNAPSELSPGTSCHF